METNDTPSIKNPIQENDISLSDVSFQKMISGANVFGQPAARLFVRIGPISEDESSKSIEYDAGPVYFSARDFGGIYLVDLKFPENALQEYRHTLEILEQFVDSIDQTTGEYDPNRILSFVFTENDIYHSGILHCPLPLFFAQTTKEFRGKCDTVRIAFARDSIMEMIYDTDNTGSVMINGTELLPDEEENNEDRGS